MKKQNRRHVHIRYIRNYKFSPVGRGGKKERKNIVCDREIREEHAIIGKKVRSGKQTEKHWTAICARHKPSDSAARSSFYSPRRVTGDGNNNGIRRFSRPTGLESRTRPCPPLYHNIAIPRCFHLRGLPRPTNQIRTCNATRDRGIAIRVRINDRSTFFPTIFFDLLHSDARNVYSFERVNVFHFHTCFVTWHAHAHFVGYV